LATLPAPPVLTLRSRNGKTGVSTRDVKPGLISAALPIRSPRPVALVPRGRRRTRDSFRSSSPPTRPSIVHQSRDPVLTRETRVTHDGILNRRLFPSFRQRRGSIPRFVGILSFPAYSRLPTPRTRPVTASTLGRPRRSSRFYSLLACSDDLNLVVVALERRTVELSLRVWPSPAPRIFPVDLSYRRDPEAPPATPLDSPRSFLHPSETGLLLWQFQGVFRAFTQANTRAFDSFLSLHPGFRRDAAKVASSPHPIAALSVAVDLFGVLTKFAAWNVPAGSWPRYPLS
jgi:hypothetical protein